MKNELKTNENEKTIAPINEDLDITKYEAEEIKRKIYTIRGKQVMIDSDLAKLYHVETKRINEAVKNNPMKFPDRFAWIITREELELCSRSKISTLNITKLKRGKNVKYLPRVFTEQGVAMLATILKSKIAIQTSIFIMDAFVEMRKLISLNGQIFERLTSVEYKLLEHDNKIDQVFNELQKNEKQEFSQKIFFEGQIYDAYSLIIDLIKKAERKLTIIDNYIDDSILKMLIKKNKNVEVLILTSKKSNIQKLDIQKFNKEYPILNVLKTDKFHDRFIIIDNKDFYHLRSIYKRFR